MFRAFAACMSGILFVVSYSALGAEQLPKSGSFTIHSGWKSIGETTQIADGRTYGSGTFWGVTFNDKGSGPLHIGPVICSSSTGCNSHAIDPPSEREGASRSRAPRVPA